MTEDLTYCVRRCSRPCRCDEYLATGTCDHELRIRADTDCRRRCIRVMIHPDTEQLVAAGHAVNDIVRRYREATGDDQ